MSDIVEGRSTLRFNVLGISRFGETEEVFTRCDGMGPGVTAIDREVLGHTLANADQHAVVLRGARVLVGADRSKAIVRPGGDGLGWIHRSLVLEVEEARMGGISSDHRGIDIPLAEETSPELSDVLDFSHHILAELV